MVQKLILQNGQATWVDLTPEEEADRLALAQEEADRQTAEDALRLDYGMALPTRQQLKAGVTTFLEYIDKPSPTPAETVVVEKMLCRAMLFVLRRQGL